MTACPKCGHQASAEGGTCEKCGQAMTNGMAPQAKQPLQKPPLPPELTGYVFEKVPPEMIEEALGPFNREEFLAGVREIEATGGYQLEDFIAELEKAVRRRE